MIGIELAVVAVCLGGVILLAYKANGPQAPAWADSEIVMGTAISLLTMGILYGISGFILSAEQLTGSGLVDALMIVVVVIAIVAGLHLATRNATRGS